MGDSSRALGPFYGNEPNPEKSLFFWAANTSKKGITLDIEKEEGRTLLKRLVSNCDVLLESFTPGYLDRLGFGGMTALIQGKPGAHYDLHHPLRGKWSLL